MNALRERDTDAEITAFLMADAVVGARAGRSTMAELAEAEATADKVLVF